MVVHIYITTFQYRYEQAIHISVPCLFVSFVIIVTASFLQIEVFNCSFFTNWSIEIYKVLISGIQTKWFSYTYKHASTHVHIFFSIVGYYKILNIVPCAIQYDLVVYLFYTEYCVSAHLKLLIYPSSRICILKCNFSSLKKKSLRR